MRTRFISSNGFSNFLQVKIQFFRSCMAIIIAFCSVFASSASAVNCTAEFPNGAQTFSSTGSISILYNAQIKSPSSTTLKSKTVSVDTGSTQISCVTGQCVASGTPVAALTSKTFKTTTSTSMITVPNGATQTLGDENNSEFKQIIGVQNATITLNPRASLYRIKDLRLQYKTVLKLYPGEYWVETLLMDSDSHIEVQGKGTVRLYVKNRLALPWLATINTNTSDASKLIIYGYGELDFQSGSTVYGVIYSETLIKLAYITNIYGAISAANIFFDSESYLTYKSDAITKATFSDMCVGTVANDVTAPVVTVNSTPATTTNASIVITGTVTDATQTNSGVFSVSAINQGVITPGTITGSTYSVTVPLVPGANAITIDARDYSNNVATKPVSVQRTSLPTIQNVTPANGVLLNTTTTTISGEVRTAWALANTQFTLNGTNQTLTQTSAGVYQFSVANVALSLGANTFLLHAVTPDGVADTSLTINYAKPDADNDGHPDDEDVFPNDPNEWADLDGDGIGDNSDPDRDGDGFSNTIETQRSTDPNNAQDYPDTVAPQLQLTTANNQSVSAATITVTGTVSDTIQPHSGLASVNAITSQGSVAASLNGSNFSVVVPLAMGTNSITIEAKDLSNNAATQTLSIQRTSLPVIQNVTPANGVHLTTTTTTITGEVKTDWAIGNVQFTLNGVTKTLTTLSSGVYKFTVTNVPLSLGANNFSLHATTPDGVADISLVIHYAKPDADGDGHPDDEDLFPNDPAEWADMDHDGIGDNSDPDRDGDGFSNTIETQRSTNPDDAQDFPDAVVPLVQITTANNQTLTVNSITITGTATDPAQNHSGLATVDAVTSQGQRIAATVTGNNFTVTVPLLLGDNIITIEARDLSNNAGTKTLNVARKSLPALQNILPASGSTLSLSSTTISGEVHTDWPLANVQLTLNNIAQTLVVISDGVYGFSVANVALAEGSNSFAIHAANPDGAVDTTLSISYVKPDSDHDGHPDDVDAFPNDPNEWADMDHDGIGDNSDSDRDGDGFSNEIEAQRSTNPNDAQDYPDTVAPSLQITTADNQNLTADSITVTGTASDPTQPHSGFSSVIASTADGQTITATLNANNFSVTLPLVMGTNTFTLTAKDISNNVTTKTFTVKRISVPLIQNVIPANNIHLTTNTTTITGEVVTNWSLGNIQFTINGVTKTLTAASAGVYQFSVANVALTLGTNTFLLHATTPDGAADISLVIHYAKPDADSDGHPDDEDAFPNDPNEWSDLDGDGIGDNADTDRDGDGISNDYEALLGTNPDSAASKPLDSDHDGIPDLYDTDRDGDGHPDIEDPFPDDASEWSDLDNDGVGDNSDSDRDGDGFSNTIEEQRGSNPNDVADYPDTVAPSLQILNVTNEQVFANHVLLRGRATDPAQPYSGMKMIIISSDRFAANIQTTVSGNAFETEIPLSLGINNLTIKAVDQSDNSVTVMHTFERKSPPHFGNITPANGSVLTTEKVTIAGEVITDLPLDQVSFYVNEWQITPSGTPVANIYSFNLPNIPLQTGQNTFVLRAVTQDGTDEKVLVVTRALENPQTIPAPKLSIITPVSGSQLRDTIFPIKGSVTTYAGLPNVTINGQPATITSSNGQDAYFSGMLSFANGENSLSVVIRASDSLQKSTTITATYYRDNTAPVISIEGGYQAAPTLNPIVRSPFTLSGTVMDSNLSSVTLNDKPLQLEPDTVTGRYRFVVPINLVAGEQSQLDFTAYDLSGNQTHTTYLFNSTATTSITPLLPNDAAEFISSGQPITVQVAARLLDSNANNTAVVSLGNATSALTIAGTLASGEVVVPAAAGNYTINYQVLNSASEVIASASREIHVVDNNSIAVEVVNHKPANGDNNIEPNQPIELYFNKPIDLAKLSISLRETLHGNTYLNSDASGEDFLNAKGYQLQRVDYDNELVPGSLSLLPGGQSLGFYANRQFGYGAELYADVNYDGKELARFTFKVRKLPTFVVGSVVDQFNQPLAGVKVNLAVGNRSTITNKDGGFAFGFQEQPGNEIPSGRYQLTINPDFATPGYGTQLRTINLQAGHKNEVGIMRLIELRTDIPFQRISSGQESVSLASDDLRLNLASAQLLFNSQGASGRTSGNIQAQFLTIEQIGERTIPGAMPSWMFAVQPRGVIVNGTVGIDIKMPALRGSYDYFQSNMVYVLLLGYNMEQGVIEPIGVGKIENYHVVSIGKVKLQSLDYLGYVTLPIENQALLKDVADGNKSLKEVLSVLQP